MDISLRLQCRMEVDNETISVSFGSHNEIVDFIADNNSTELHSQSFNRTKSNRPSGVLNLVVTTVCQSISEHE